MSTTVFTPRYLSLAAIVCTMVASVGCKSDVQQRTYEVSVRNESAMPVTVWLTKEGPLDNETYERNWKSPEDLAIESRQAGEMLAGYVVKPGESVSTGQVSGNFHPQNTAILRVYLGSHNFSDLLAIGKGAPDRKDFELDHGSNAFTVVDQDGMILVRRQEHAMNMSTEAAPAPQK